MNMSHDSCRKCLWLIFSFTYSFFIIFPVFYCNKANCDIIYIVLPTRFSRKLAIVCRNVIGCEENALSHSFYNRIVCYFPGALREDVTYSILCNYTTYCIHALFIDFIFYTRYPQMPIWPFLFATICPGEHIKIEISHFELLFKKMSLM